MEKSSYDVYLWQDTYGRFESDAIECHDGKNEVRLHEGKPPITVIPRGPPECWACGGTSYVSDMRRMEASCVACGLVVFQESLRARQ